MQQSLLSEDALNILKCLSPEFIRVENESMLRLRAMIELEMAELIEIRWSRGDVWHVRLKRNASTFVPQMFN